MLPNMEGWMSSNHAELMLYRHCREGRGDRTALYFRGETYRYEEIADAAASCAAWLRTTGVTGGDTVLVSLPDCPALAAIYFGIVTVGATAILVDPSLATEDAFYIAQVAATKLVIAHEASIARVLSLRFLPGMIAVVGAGLSWRSSSEIVASAAVTHASEYPLPPSADAPAYGLLSSGSTGRPKLIVHRHGDILHAYRGFALPVVALAPSDRAICVAKLTTGYGMGCSILMPFLAGASAALVAEPPGPSHAEAIAAYRCTLLFAQPRFPRGVALPRRHAGRLAESALRDDRRRAARAFPAGSLGAVLRDRAARLLRQHRSRVSVHREPPRVGAARLGGRAGRWPRDRDRR